MTIKWLGGNAQSAAQPINRCPNPALEGGASGTPGTMPACWDDGFVNAGTLARSITTAGPKLQLRLQGTGGTNPAYTLYTDGGTYSYFTPAQKISWSSNIHKAAGAMTNVSYMEMGVEFWNDAFGYISNLLSADLTASITTSAQRFTMSGTVAALNAHTLLYYRFYFTNSAAVDVTFELSQLLAVQT